MPEAGAKYPRCLAGAQACPPEDCGGSGGYERLLRILANPKNREYADMRRWAGDFESERFSVEEATETMLQGVFDWRSEDNLI